MPRGRKPGSKNLATLSKEQGREALRQVVMKHMDDMVQAQVANAKGLNFLVVRAKNSGKFIRRITEDGEIKLDPEHEIAEIWGKDPSVQAFTDLMNRALDKPKEQLLEVDVNVTGLYDRIRAARERVNS